MHWPVWFTWYKKPDYRDIKEYSTIISSGKRSFSPDSRGGAIPSQLKLERVLENKTCEQLPAVFRCTRLKKIFLGSPMSLHDFYMLVRKHQPEAII